MTETTIEFPRQSSPKRPPTSDTAFGLPGTQGPAPITAGTARSTVRGSMALAPIPIDKLYPAEKNSASDLIAALGLLAEAIGLLERARAAARDKEVIPADRYWQRFQVLLPDLFVRRKIGDGYGVVINSLHFACINQHGRPLSFEQLTTVWRVVKELRNSPFVSFEQGLKYVSELEECDLAVDPPVLSELIEESEDE
jgi:hypothetical protein